MVVNVSQSLNRVPAQIIDAAGVQHVDLRAIVALALPLIANSGVQLILNLTDMWFIGRISTSALAAVGAVNWLALVVVFILSGVGMAVQTVAAQAYGARRASRASQAVWIGLWGVVLATPLFILVGLAGRWVLQPFGISEDIQHLAYQFWLPRVAGAPFGAAVWGVLGFFNGIGRPRVTLLVTAVMAIANVLLNQWFVFGMGLGVAGSGIASTAAQAMGLMVGLAVFLAPHYRRSYHSHLTWRPRRMPMLAQFRLGLPMGMLIAADLLGLSIFQLMQVKLSAVAGAATQVVLVLTAVSYMPGVGIAMAGTTLIGQSIGAGERAWAYRLGNRIIAMVALYMGIVGIVLALAGPWVLPWFVSAGDAQARAVVSLGAILLWLAAAYQFFDGMNLGSAFCLRGAGDAAVPAVLVLLLSWGLFVPLAHVLSFAPGEGWVNWMPRLGYGSIGGWCALVGYVLLLGVALYLRWRSRAWLARGHALAARSGVSATRL
jgi:multidrug resistance protein, MATE family